MNGKGKKERREHRLRDRPPLATAANSSKESSPSHINHESVNRNERSTAGWELRVRRW
jgi:hypothetical protein